MTYSSNDVLNALLVRLHVEEGLDLAQSKVLAVTQSDKLVESAEQFESIAQDFPLIQASADASNNLGEEVERVDVLENVGLTVCDEDHVQLVQGLINETDIVLLDGRVLGAAVGELGKRGEKSFNSRSLHLTELARQDGLTAACADGCCQNHLYHCVSLPCAPSRSFRE